MTERFEIHIANEILADLHDRLTNIRWPGTRDSSPWERGADYDYLYSLIAYWKEGFDWRKQEANLNSLHQFCCTIDGVDIHFIHEKGKGPNPMPLILSHGWPDSIVRYQKIIPLLTDPASYGGNSVDSFDVIIPSLPGFGFSNAPQVRGYNNAQISDLWAKLMTDILGYKKFSAAGGDIGSGVTRYLAINHPEMLYGIHLTDIGIIRDIIARQDFELSGEEARYKELATNWLSQEGAYMSMQSTKPLTLAYGLSDSPVGLAAWIIEKFRAWSDCDGDLANVFSKDELLTNIMLYWATNSIGSSARIYFENSHTLPKMKKIDIPTGMALFPADILLPPKIWTEQNLNIVQWTEMPKGGHFTAMEVPTLFTEDIRAFFRIFR